MGRALLVASPASRAPTLGLLQQLGYATDEVDDPYAAMAELSRRPLQYRAMVLGLGSFYREELTIVAVVKRRFPHIEIWLTQTDGRAAALAEAMRLGADGLVGEDGLHRIALSGASSSDSNSRHDGNGLDTSQPGQEAHAEDDLTASSERAITEPLLTADELRALLQEHTMSPGEEPA